MNINSLFGVIVLYETTLAESKTFKSIQKGLRKQNIPFDILVYDNSSEPKYSSEYFEVENTRINYIHDSSNSGISKAYNVGAKMARKLNKSWLLLMDQDTEFPPTIFDAYLSGIEHHPSIKLIAPILKLTNGTIFSPCHYIFKRGFTKKIVKPGINQFKKSSPVNSGMLVNLEAFEKAGGYNESIKLDFSDFQFIEKFRVENNRFLLLDNVAIQDFSNDITNITSLVKRYEIYCNDAKNCIPIRFYDPVIYMINALLRAMKLYVRTRDLMFLKIWLKMFVL